jgi:crotonobetainyl-CoA:carnitine CoA-transferase CaiB-like acyl-CoA transferase
MTALLHRQRTGEGQWIDLSQLEAATSGLIGEHLLEYSANGTQTLPIGNRHSYHAPQGCYRCKGTDKWVALVIRSNEEWERLCDVMNRSELKADLTLRSSIAPAQRHDQIDRVIEEWTLQRTHLSATHLLQQELFWMSKNSPVMPIFTSESFSRL